MLSFGKTLVITGHDITHLEGEGNYTFVHTRYGNKYLVSKTIKTIQGNLSDSFLRVHKSFIINQDHVTSWPEPCSLLLCCGKRIPVARRRFRQTEQLLSAQYLKLG